MPNIKLIGFSQEEAEKLIINVANEVRDKTTFAEKVAITNFPGSTCVSTILTPMPYFCICNTSEGGTTEENEQLTEILKQFGYDIEWGKIEKFFQAPDFPEWGK